MCGIKLNERKRREEVRELLRLELVSLMIKKSRLRWNGHVELKSDTEWVKRCMTLENEGVIHRDAKRRLGGIVSRMIWKV